MAITSEKVVISPWAQKEIDVPSDITLPEFIFSSLREKLPTIGDLPFVIDVVTGKEIPFSKLEEMCRSLASSLWQRGLRRGSLLFFTTHDHALIYVVQIACWMCGAAVRGCFPWEDAEEMERQMRESQPQMVLCDPDTASTVLPILPNLDMPQIKLLSLCGAVDGAVSVEDLIEKDDAPALPDDIGISPKEDVASIFNTSGCTGLPKGAVHTHYTIISLLCNARGLMGNGALFTQMPNFLAGTILCIAHCVWMGYSYLSLSRFTPDTFFDYLDKYKPGSIFLFGFMVNWFAHAPEVHSRDLSYIERITIGGSFLDVASTKALATTHPQAKIIQLFGISEALYIAGTEVAEGVENVNESSDKAIMVKGIKSIIIDGDYCLTTGKLLPSVKAKVIDINTGVEVGPLEKGEMLIKNTYMMKGYITSDSKERYKSGLDADGWFHSGDLVAYDHAGNIYPFDRTAHVFQCYEHQIVPLEIEAVLAQHPSVLTSCVVGIPNAEATNLARAYIVLRPGEENQGVTADELIAFVKDKLASHKQLHGGVKFVTHLPMKRCILLDRAALLKQILSEESMS